MAKEEGLRIILYDDPSCKTLDVKEIADYIKGLFKQTFVETREEFLTYHIKGDTKLRERIAKELASARITNIMAELKTREPMYGEIEVEKRNLMAPAKRVVAIMYDGFVVQNSYSKLISAEESYFYYIHIAFIGRLIGTFDESDKRYHARVIICGFPSLISTVGIVEAPAKPREFYVALRSYPSMSASLAWEVLKEKFKDSFIDYDDERINEVMKGYVAQAVFYQLFGEAFCESKDCRLYNSHWQEEVIRSQLKSGKLCEKHEKMARSLKT